MNAGWYADAATGWERYFDGSRWTDQYRQISVPPDSEAQVPRSTQEPLPQFQRTNGFAVASLVTAVLGLSLVAIVLGHVGRAQVRRSLGAQRGSGLGLAGLIIGYVQLAAMVAAVVLVLLVAGTTDSQSTTANGEVEPSASQPVATDPTPSSTDLPRPPGGIRLNDATECPPSEGVRERIEMFTAPPPLCIDPAVSYFATFSTTEGAFTAKLDPTTAPVTVNNFVVLARYGYYDGVPFHRVVPNFIIQAGDGDGDPWGSNDIGYTIEDELPADASGYPDFSLAMANSGPDTGSSQFFVVLPGGGASINPLYSRFGQVIAGTEVVEAISALGTPDGAAPREPVVIEDVTITTG